MKNEFFLDTKCVGGERRGQQYKFSRDPRDKYEDVISKNLIG